MKSHTEENRIRPDILTSAVYLSVIIMMIFGIVCQRIYGDKGAYFSAAPSFIYAICYMGVVLAAQKAVYVMVRLRARRSQYLNAEDNMKKSIRVLAIVAVIFGALLMILSYKFADKLLGTQRGFFQLFIVGAAILFLGGQGVIRGYLQGIGYTRPIFLADILMAGICFVTGTVVTGLLYKYGVQVNDLFHVDEFSAVYGSCGMMIGFFAGAFAGFIQTGISYRIRKSEIADFVKSGTPKYLDNKNDVIASIRPHLLLYISLPLMALLDQIVYVIFTRKVNETFDYMTDFGVYAGRIITTVILLSVLCCIFFVKKWNGIMARFERDELEGARERFKRMLRYFNMLLIPLSVFCFVMAGTIQGAIFGKTAPLCDKLMMAGALCIFLLTTAIMFSWLISHMGKSMVIIVNTSVAWGAHIVGLILFVIVFKLGIFGLIFATILSLIAYNALSFLMISKILSFRLNIRMTILYSLAGSVLSGIIVLLLNKLLVNLIGEILTLILCIVIYWILFMLFMIATRGIRYHELSRMPLGILFKQIALMLGNGNREEG